VLFEHPASGRRGPVLPDETLCRPAAAAYDSRVTWSAIGRSSLGVLLTSALSGCAGLGGLSADARAVATHPPANVAVYLNVSSNDTTRLTAENFTLSEDGHELHPSITRQMLLDPAKVVHHHTLLLVDNSLATDAGVRGELANAIAAFAEEVTPTQTVAVYAYDGGTRLTPVTVFPRVNQPSPTALPQARLAPRDVSRNLNGAILLAGAELDRLLKWSGKPLGVGTLVVFAAGADLAGRTEEGSVHEWLGTTRHRVLAIGYGEQSYAVEEFAKDGYYDAVGADTVSLAFEEAGHAVARESREGYLLSYCSPARGGTRVLQLEVHTGPADAERSGSTSVEFSAEGFRAGCDPRSLPKFEAPKASE